MNRNMSKLKDRTFSTRLRALYDAAPYDRKDLARKMGVSISTLVRWEDGDAVPDVIRLKKMAVYFGLPYEFFLEYPSPAPKEEPMKNWEIADRLGLSESTVERLMELAETAPGEALDHLDDAVFSLTETALASRGDWNAD